MSALWSSPASALPFSCKLAPHMLSPQQLELVTPCQRTSLRLLKTHFAWGHRELRVPEDFHPRSPWPRVTPFLPLLSLGLPFPLPSLVFPDNTSQWVTSAELFLHSRSSGSISQHFREDAHGCPWKHWHSPGRASSEGRAPSPQWSPMLLVPITSASTTLFSQPLGYVASY